MRESDFRGHHGVVAGHVRDGIAKPVLQLDVHPLPYKPSNARMTVTSEAFDGSDGLPSVRRRPSLGRVFQQRTVVCGLRASCAPARARNQRA